MHNSLSSLLKPTNYILVTDGFQITDVLMFSGGSKGNIGQIRVNSQYNSLLYKLFPLNNDLLIHFWPVFSFNAPSKYQKTFIF